MARILVVTFDSGGNVPPMLGIAGLVKKLARNAPLKPRPPGAVGDVIFTAHRGCTGRGHVC
jgi:hypothetical protein